MDQSHLAWHKSTLSSNDGCVEVAPAGDQVAVRDSKDRNSLVLCFTAREWDAFVAGIRNGEFGLPCKTG